MIDDADTIHLERAIQLACTSVDTTGGPFGAVVVKNNQVIGEGHNQVTTSNDPTAHAEIVAIRDACHNIQDFNLSGATIYASCEPCPMCMSAIYWARISRVVYAASGQDAARAGFDDTLIAREICTPYDHRSIMVEQHDIPGRDRCFERWIKKTDKIEY